MSTLLRYRQDWVSRLRLDRQQDELRLLFWLRGLREMSWERVIGHMSSNEGLFWLIGFVVFGVGFICWIAVIARDDLRRRQDLKQLERNCPREIQELALYVNRLWGPPTGLRVAHSLVLAPSSTDAEDCTPAAMVTVDLLVILKMLREASSKPDVLRPSDKQKDLLRMFAAKIRNRDILNMQPWQLETWILNLDVDAIVGLNILATMGHADRHTLRDLYLAFAKLASESSSDILAPVLERIRDAAVTEEERLEESVKKLEDLQDVCFDLLVDAHRRVLEVDADCSEEQLKASYRRLVSLWHPDKLQAMAPQLQELAGAKVAELNKAYAALSGTSITT